MWSETNITLSAPRAPSSVSRASMFFAASGRVMRTTSCPSWTRPSAVCQPFRASLAPCGSLHMQKSRLALASKRPTGRIALYSRDAPLNVLCPVEVCGDRDESMAHRKQQLVGAAGQLERSVANRKSADPPQCHFRNDGRLVLTNDGVRTGEDAVFRTFGVDLDEIDSLDSFPP